MIIQCPTCKREREIARTERGAFAECSCGRRFAVDGANVVQASSFIDEPGPAKIGPYRIEKRLGCGGMSVVYLSTHPKLGVPVAVKVMKPAFARDKDAADRFVRTAKICARLNHPNVVRVYDFGTDDFGCPFLVMECIPGGTMHDMLQREGPLPHALIVNAIASACLGLAAAESAGIVHRDVKPDNIMIAGDGVYKISDLGLARSESVRHGARTMPHSVLGTPEYMAPEQARDASACDIRADIYSLGASMYQLATGRLPFQPNAFDENPESSERKDPLVPSALRPDLPADFDYLVMRCLQTLPEDRYQTISELLADLRAFLDGKTLPSTMQNEQRTRAMEATDLAVKRSIAPRARACARPVRRAKLKRAAIRAGVFFCIVVAVALLLFLSKKGGRNHTEPFPSLPPPIALPAGVEGFAEAPPSPSQPLPLALDPATDEAAVRSGEGENGFERGMQGESAGDRSDAPESADERIRRGEEPQALPEIPHDADAPTAEKDETAPPFRKVEAGEIDPTASFESEPLSFAAGSLPTEPLRTPVRENPADAAFRSELTELLSGFDLGSELPDPQELARKEFFSGLSMESRLALRLGLTKLKNARMKGLLAKRYQNALQTAIENLSMSNRGAVPRTKEKRKRSHE